MEKRPERLGYDLTLPSIRLGTEIAFMALGIETQGPKGSWIF